MDGTKELPWLDMVLWPREDMHQFVETVETRMIVLEHQLSWNSPPKCTLNLGFTAERRSINKWELEFKQIQWILMYLQYMTVVVSLTQYYHSEAIKPGAIRLRQIKLKDKLFPPKFEPNSFLDKYSRSTVDIVSRFKPHPLHM
jgi:hypothetical protein